MAETKTAAKTATNSNATQPATLYAGLAYFQSIVPAIAKGDTAGSGNFKYKYGSLPDIMETIKPHMAAAGLGFTQPIIWDGEREVIKTILFHVSDDKTIESTIELPGIEFKGMNVVQSKGSVITYLRRYSLMSILGIVTDEDDTDAQGEAKAKSKSEPNAPKTGGKAETGADSLPWLNPEVNGKPNPLWNQALKYLADGGKIATIKTKYKIGKNNEERLLNEALAFDDLPFDRQEIEANAEAADTTVNPDADPLNKPNDLFDQQGEIDNPDHY